MLFVGPGAGAAVDISLAAGTTVEPPRGNCGENAPALLGWNRGASGIQDLVLAAAMLAGSPTRQTLQLRDGQFLDSQKGQRGSV